MDCPGFPPKSGKIMGSLPPRGAAPFQTLIDGVLTDCFPRWVRALTLGPSARVRALHVGNCAPSNVKNALHAHARVCAKIPPAGLEPATLTPVAQAITQLAKWSGGPWRFALGLVLVVYRYRTRSGFSDLKPNGRPKDWWPQKMEKIRKMGKMEKMEK